MFQGNHARIDRTERYPGLDVDDAQELAEHTALRGLSVPRIRVPATTAKEKAIEDAGWRIRQPTAGEATPPGFGSRGGGRQSATTGSSLTSPEPVVSPH